MALKDFKSIGDDLTESEYNGIVSLYRHFITHQDNIRIASQTPGVYGIYNFDIEDTTILDTGILITDETITAEPKVQLTSNSFVKSTYTLILNVLHYTGVNILDDVTPENYKVVDTLEITLTPNEWVSIPVEDLEKGYIIDFDCRVEIAHDQTIIGGIGTRFKLTSDKDIIQVDEVADITCKACDDVQPLNGKTVYFYEVFEPFSLGISSDKSIIQTSETADVTAKLKDKDGSLVEDEPIYFYEIVEE